MANLDIVRVGLIGYGLAGEFFHAPLIAATPGLLLTDIVTSDPERARRAGAAHAHARIHGTVERLWNFANELNLVVVATPNRTHVALAERALESGLAVVVDKPLAPSAREGRHLVELAARTGMMLTVFQNRRWDGDFLTVRRLVNSDALGTVARFESRFERWRPVPKPGWRQEADPEAAGGVLFDLGSHLIDQALLLFGPVEHVHAELDRRASGGKVDDDTFVSLTHSSGVRSHLWMSTVAAQPGPRFRVLGSSGAYVKHGYDVQEAALRAGGRPHEPGWGEEDETSWGMLGAEDSIQSVRTEAGGYMRFYEGIRRSLADGSPPPVNAADAVAVLEIIEAARRLTS